MQSLAKAKSHKTPKIVPRTVRKYIMHTATPGVSSRTAAFSDASPPHYQVEIERGKAKVLERSLRPNALVDTQVSSNMLHEIQIPSTISSNYYLHSASFYASTDWYFFVNSINFTHRPSFHPSIFFHSGFSDPRTTLIHHKNEATTRSAYDILSP